MARNLGNLHARLHFALPVVPIPSIRVANWRFSPQQFEIFSLQVTMAQSMRRDTPLPFRDAELIHHVVVPRIPPLQGVVLRYHRATVRSCDAACDPKNASLMLVANRHNTETAILRTMANV